MHDLEHAHPAVISLVKSVCAEVWTFKEALEKGAELNEYIMGANGFYDGSSGEVTSDVIGINTDKYAQDINETLLHELIHWTGRASRLCRKGIANRGNTQRIIDTEEAIAQIGMYELTVFLGFGSSVYRFKRDSYLENLIYADEYRAQLKAKQAVEFLTELYGRKAA